MVSQLESPLFLWRFACGDLFVVEDPKLWEMPGRRSYSTEFKLKVIERYHELNDNVSLCATEFKITRREIQRWRSQYDKLRDLTARTRKHGKTMRRRRRLDYTKTCRFPDMEEELVAWVKQLRKEGHAVHGKSIQKKAKDIIADFYGGDVIFNASNGWLNRFLRRHGLVSRRVTTQGQGIPGNAAEQSKKFMADMKTASSALPLNAVGNMDETPFWFDLPSAETYDFKGLKTIKSRTTGNEKLRFTVVLTALANGAKLKPMLIFKGLKNVPKGKFPDGCVVTVAKGESMTGELLQREWAEKVWRTRPGNLFQAPGVMVYDRHRSHTHHDSVSHLERRHNTEVILIPAGMTSLQQPCDVVWNKPLKDRVRAMWNEWMVSGEQQFTRGGKRKRASYHMVAEWVVAAWQDIPRTMIEASFVQCDLVGNGSEDFDVLHSSLRHLLTTGEPPENEVATESELDSTGESEEDSDNADVPMAAGGGNAAAADDDDDDAILLGSSDGEVFDTGSDDNSSSSGDEIGGGNAAAAAADDDAILLGSSDGEVFDTGSDDDSGSGDEIDVNIGSDDEIGDMDSDVSVDDDVQ